MKLDANTVMIHEEAVSSTMELHSRIAEYFGHIYGKEFVRDNQQLIGHLVIAAAIRMSKIEKDPIIDILQNK